MTINVGENSYARRTMLTKSETLLNPENANSPSRPYSAIALWPIYPREIKWFSIEHIINKNANKSACDNRRERELKKYKLNRKKSATFCLTTRLMDYKSISRNGHQLRTPLHQDNVNLTTLQAFIFISNICVNKNQHQNVAADKSRKNHSKFIRRHANAIKAKINRQPITLRWN